MDYAQHRKNEVFAELFSKSDRVPPVATGEIPTTSKNAGKVNLFCLGKIKRETHVWGFLF